MHRAILHVDMDAFFASVEQRDNPALLGKPVIVGGTGARGVVAAASYEVRRYGVHSAMPMQRALALCPDAICVTPRMSRYREVSAQVFAIFGDFTPLVEGLSVDEAFLDVTACQQLHGNAERIAANIKQRIRSECDLSASIGIAPNKLVAKIASDLNKPDGLTLVTPEQIHAVLDPLPVQRLPGLGRKKGEAVRAAGIATLGELRRAPDALLWPLFGRDSERQRQRAAGVDDRVVAASEREVSISAERTFDRDISDAARLHMQLRELADRTSQRLRARGLLAGSLHIKLRRGDFTTFTRQRPLVPPSQHSTQLADAAALLLDAWLKEQPGAALRLLGVGATDLQETSQLDLFAAPPQRLNPGLDRAIDQIRSRFGSTALRRGSATGDGGK
jgi:DNA polymerase-4